MKVSHIKKLNKFRERLSAMRDELDTIAGEYRDKFDNASDSWQQSEKGIVTDNEVEVLEQAAADVESAESAIANAIEFN